MDYFNNTGVLFLEGDDFNKDGSFKYSQDGKPMLIMLFGTFCGHCKSTAPVFAQLFNQYKNKIMCAVIQVDGGSSEQQAVAILRASVAPHLSGIPAFLLYKNGKYQATYSGERTLAALAGFATES